MTILSAKRFNWCRLVVALVAPFTLAACETVIVEVPARKPALAAATANAKPTSPPAATTQTTPTGVAAAPSQTAATSVATAPKVAAQPAPVSPYSFTGPLIGKWALIPDPQFTIVFAENGQVAYGPYLSGAYRVLDNRAIELRLVGQSGPYAGKQPGPIVFALEFAENGQVLVLRQGDSGLVLRRLQ